MDVTKNVIFPLKIMDLGRLKDIGTNNYWTLYILKQGLFYSLKSRYAAVSVLLTIIVIASAIIGYRILASTQSEATSNEQVRTNTLNTTRQVRNAVWNSREYLEEFILDPRADGIQNKIQTELKSAVTLTHQMVDDKTVSSDDYTNTLVRLETSLSELSEYIHLIVDTRLDTQKQFPAMRIANNEMQPTENVFYSSTEVAINEILEESEEGYNSEVFLTFIKSRQLWARLISNFRMYLANRLGSFSVESLPLQEKDNELLVSEIKNNIKKLGEFNDNEKLEFIGIESYENMKNAIVQWEIGYKKVIAIHHSDSWRSDKPILLNHVKPLYFDIWESLLNIEKIQRTSALEDINNLTKISNMQQKLLIAIAFIAIVIIFIGYFALKTSILKPIALLTDAIDKASTEDKQCSLPAANAIETKRLLNAFQSMQTEIHARQEQLKHQAMHDDLTGLPNRNLMKERLKYIIARSKRDKTTPVLLMMDLNGFKEVNDTLGHHTGDLLLVSVAKRLITLLRESDTIVRLGGDEFAVLLEDISIANAKYVSTKINNLIQQPFTVNENQLYISVSIGIAHYPLHGKTGNMLIQHADVAMYHAKRNKLGATIYDESIDENKTQKLSLISDLRNALAKNELELYFQPKIDLKHNNIYGAEALLRWNHPENGFIPPEEIVTMAEQSGLVHELFEWVFEQAAYQVRLWINKKIELNIAVNLSVYDLQHHDIVNSIQQTLEKYSLSPDYFTVEVTESAMMADPEKTISKLSDIDNMGVRIAIDDYGTGYSSLSYLKKLPVYELKIDKSFVMQMDLDENDAIIVRSTIDLAHNLGLKVVAEGVESKEINDLLLILGCDTSQGYHWAKPMPPNELETWLIKNNFTCSLQFKNQA